MEQFWDHLFEIELRLEHGLNPILLTEPALNPKPHREKSAELLFERFNVPSMHAAAQPALAMFASVGRLSPSIVVDIGEDISSVVPLYNEHVMDLSVVQLEVSGRALTEYMVGLLNARGLAFETAGEREVARDIKESLGRVALEYEEGTSSAEQQEYTMPDGQVVNVGSERFKCAEALFRPSLLGLSSLGIQEGVWRAIEECDVDVRGEMYSKIILNGGSTLFRGFKDRLVRELLALVPSGTRLNVSDPPERKFSSWIGGSVVASLSNFQSKLISQEEYNEIGPVVVNWKCY
uniref:Actin n=1 Tax=Arcella intermedia TaxID=1963864 RepID=A0A6B2LC03_9EUKA|eukprot:TRINITY_DN3139_c0_g1_i4.p1 TRINITY_DN3139_c0_g1~~TRINITY_DN3139_c0_g1_i4.p1  ORF type:complete len:292 (+),score=64.91 TRINITY_DN3139_c0_g1_i4:942-1817(+)